jgi:hypothetical protein
MDKLKLEPSLLILLCMLFAIMFLIYKTYQTNLTSKTYLINVYLYVFVALLMVVVIGNITKSTNITDSKNMTQLLITYLIIVFVGICVMLSDKIFVSHIGFLLLIIALGLITGSLFRYSTNIVQATILSSIIVIALSMVVFFASENTMVNLSRWTPILSWLLVCLIFAQVFNIFFDKEGKYINIIRGVVVVLFAMFVLSDTGRIILKSKKVTSVCKTHSCVNYPRESLNITLDYLNIFSALTNK